MEIDFYPTDSRQLTIDGMLSPPRLREEIAIKFSVYRTPGSGNEVYFFAEGLRHLDVVTEIERARAELERLGVGIACKAPDDSLVVMWSSTSVRPLHPEDPEEAAALLEHVRGEIERLLSDLAPSKNVRAYHRPAPVTQP